MSERRDIIVVPKSVLTEGVTNRFPIDIGEFFHSLSLKIEGIITLTGGTGATLREGGILNFIKNIIIEISGGITPKNINGELLYDMNAYDMGTPPTYNEAAVAVGANAFSVELMIPFSVFNAEPNDATIFNSRRHKPRETNEMFNLAVILGTTTDIYSDLGGGTAALSSLFLTVKAKQEVGEDLENIYHPINHESMKAVRKVLSGAGEFKTAVSLKSGNWLKRIALIAEDANDLDDNDVVGEVRVRKGMNTYLKQIDWEELQNENKSRYGLESIIKGFAMIELDEDEMFDQMMDTSKENQVYLEVVTTATTHLTVLTQEILIGE